MAHPQLPSITSGTAPIVVQATISRSSLPPFIPPEDRHARAGKMLIVCFDGTGNEFNTDNSNIVQLVSMLKKDDKTRQMVYYQVRLALFVLPILIYGKFVAWHRDVPLTRIGYIYASHSQDIQGDYLHLRCQ